MARMETIRREAEAVAKRAREAVQESKGAIRSVAEFPAHGPFPLYVGLTLGSIILSVTLFARREKENAIFVGLWAPTFLALGLMHKLFEESKK